MFSSLHYAIRSKADGQYLVANIPNTDSEIPKRYLFLFQESYEAMSYLNSHASGMAAQFGIETVSQTQLKGIIQRWGFEGIALVKDPLEPRIQFLQLT